MNGQRTYVFIVKDMRSGKRIRHLLRVKNTGDKHRDLRSAINAIKIEILVDPTHMWQLTGHVWQVLDGKVNNLYKEPKV